MEEDIKILEDMLNKESNIYKRNKRGNKEIKFEVNSNYYKAIENLIKGYRELGKEYERVRTGRNWLSEHISAQIATPELFDKILEEDYIPKSKIKEKIEELLRYVGVVGMLVSDEEVSRAESQIEILEELMEDK